jgi:hypothetical protein
MRPQPLACGTNHRARFTHQSAAKHHRTPGGQRRRVAWRPRTRAFCHATSFGGAHIAKRAGAKVPSLPLLRCPCARTELPSSASCTHRQRGARARVVSSDEQEREHSPARRRHTRGRGRAERLGSRSSRCSPGTQTAFTELSAGPTCPSSGDAPSPSSGCPPELAWVAGAWLVEVTNVARGGRFLSLISTLCDAKCDFGSTVIRP